MGVKSYNYKEAIKNVGISIIDLVSNVILMFKSTRNIITAVVIGMALKVGVPLVKSIQDFAILIGVIAGVAGISMGTKTLERRANNNKK